MEVELLKREKEYYDINGQLEIRTKQILEQVDNVIKIQDSLLSRKDFLPSAQTVPESVSRYPSTSFINHLEDNGVNINIKECKELNLPPDIGSLGSKGLITLLKAKLKKLQRDFDKLHLEFQSKIEECKKYRAENQNLLENKTKWMQSIAISKNNNHKLENNLNLLQLKLQTKEIENTNLKKEIDILKKGIRSNNLINTNIDAKLNKALEDGEKLKTALRTAKQEEKDRRENTKNRIDELTDTIKKLENERHDYVSAFKKQHLLIENLKNQKANINNLKVADKMEMDFMKILDWKEEKKKSKKVNSISHIKT